MKFLMFIMLFSSIAFADEKMDEKSKAHMEAQMKMAQPGAEHELLKKMEGSWTAVTKMWMDPKAAAMESTGKSVNKMMYGGRFLHQEFSSTHAGQPFEGMGIAGYDNMKKKYVSTWNDSMSTGIMVSYGPASQDGKSFTVTGDYDDPMTKKKMKMKMTTRIESDTKHVFEMFHPDSKGKEYKSMEITYTKD